MKPILREDGFTLTEIMVALAIISLVTGLIAVNVVGSFRQAKVKTAKLEISALEAAVEELNRDCRRYPRSEEGLNALIQKPADCGNWKPGGYLDKQRIKLDPWNHEYLYNLPPIYGQKGKYEIVSLGADGVEGGQEDDADIISSTMEL